MAAASAIDGVSGARSRFDRRLGYSALRPRVAGRI